MYSLPALRLLPLLFVAWTAVAAGQIIDVIGGQKISNERGGLAEPLDDSHQFGRAVASLGDLDGDGVGDIAVGASGDNDGGPGRGAVYILFLNPDGTVKTEQKISSTDGGLADTLEDEDVFGSSLARLGDLDGDGTTELAVGAGGDDDGGSNAGAVYVLFLAADGTVGAQQKISLLEGGFSGAFEPSDRFGELAGPGDVDGDGIPDLVVGARGDDDGGTDRGALYVLFLDVAGGVAGQQKISDTEGGLNQDLLEEGRFGGAISGLPDIDGNGVPELVVGASFGVEDFPAGRVYLLKLQSNGMVASSRQLQYGEDLPQINEHFGSSIATIGDVNGDSFADLAITSNVFTSSVLPITSRAVDIVLLDNEGTIIDADRISNDLSAIPGAPYYPSLPHPLESTWGADLAYLGDIDRNGTADLLVGDPSDNIDSGVEGAAYIVNLQGQQQVPVPALNRIGTLILALALLCGALYAFRYIAKSSNA